MHNKNKLSYGFLLTSLLLSFATIDAADRQADAPKIDAPKQPPAPAQPQRIQQAETPYGIIFPKDKGELEYISFDIYDIEPVDENVKPKDSLPKSTTTYVYGMLTVKNLLKGLQDQEYKITYKYYSQTGQLLGQSDSTFSVKKEWQFATFYSNWGWDQPRNWAIGNYTLELWIDDNKFAVKKFSIVNE
jgi:hypothetical protein